MKTNYIHFRRHHLLTILVCAMTCFIVPTIAVTRKDLPPDPTPSQVSVDKQKPRGESIETPFAPQHPVTCESFAALVDHAVIEWQGMQGTHLIFIARMGKGEKAGNLNKFRLKDVEDYLKRYKVINYVTAEGSRGEGLGKVELYVGGKLRTVIPVERNAKRVCSGKVNPFL